jgi:hypothetical protein
MNANNLIGLFNPLINLLFGGRKGGARNGGDQGADPIEEQKKLNLKVAWDTFYTNKEKLLTDSNAAKAAGIMDSANKQINSMTTLGKGINF